MSMDSLAGPFLAGLNFVARTEVSTSKGMSLRPRLPRSRTINHAPPTTKLTTITLTSPNRPQAEDDSTGREVGDFISSDKPKAA